MRRIDLCPGLDGRRTAWLRPLDGWAEEAAATSGAAALLARCLVGADGALSPDCLTDLPLADRDRLLSALQHEAFGARIEADGTCAECGAGYALAFGLDELSAAARGSGGCAAEGPDARGLYRLGDIVFRLPSTRDAEAARTAADPRGAILAACVQAGELAGHEAAVEAAIAAAGPVLDVDLDATCPACGLPQAPRFRLEDFVAQSFAAEAPLRLREIHCIATGYGWSHDSIMGLSRADRQSFVRLILEASGRGTGSSRTVERGAVRARAAS